MTQHNQPHLFRFCLGYTNASIRPDGPAPTTTTSLNEGLNSSPLTAAVSVWMISILSDLIDSALKPGDALVDEDDRIGDTLRFMRSQIDAAIVLMQGRPGVENGGRVASSSPMRPLRRSWQVGSRISAQPKALLRPKKFVIGCVV